MARLFADDVYVEAAREMLGAPVRGRSCGSCTACCTQIPVELSDDERKPANVRCRHLRSKGCGIYAKRPLPCRVWSCRWLFDADTGELRRPDQSGVVIDCTPDTVLAEGEPKLVVQVWCDPARREAYHDPALLRYLDKLVHERGMFGVIVRWSSSEGVILIPPSVHGVEGEGDTWLEVDGAMNSAEVMRAKLAEAGVARFRMAGGEADG